mmetsp:Transcript_3926/g.15972  ORF Transcript_3926/g.15972 Transcript_3926/m.15972 type:complete len:422 (-) Transcript_3926:61-1326(-)
MHARHRLRHDPDAGQVRAPRVLERGRGLVPHGEEEGGELGGGDGDALATIRARTARPSPRPSTVGDAEKLLDGTSRGYRRARAPRRVKRNPRALRGPRTPRPRVFLPVRTAVRIVAVAVAVVVAPPPAVTAPFPVFVVTFAVKVQRGGRGADEHLQKPSTRSQQPEPRLRLRGTHPGRGHVPELGGQPAGDDSNRAVARPGHEARGRRVVTAPEELREVSERRGGGVRADEPRRGVEEGLEHGGRVPAHRRSDVRERGADVEDQSSREGRDAVRSEGWEDAGPERAPRGGAHDLFLVDEALGDLLDARRRARHERRGMGLEELFDAVERVFPHPRAVVLALVQELGHGQPASRDLISLALRAERLDREVDALRPHLGVCLVRLLADLAPNLLLGADEVDAGALLVVHALRLLTHPARVSSR